MPIKYPLTVITNNQKYGFCYRVQEALRLKHNEMGQKFKDKKISADQWEAWRNDWYQPREDALIEVLLALRYVIRTNNPQSINLEEVIQI